MILTDVGRAKLLSGNLKEITEFAVGDGGGATVSPTSGWTSLVNEVWRGKISSVVKQESGDLVIKTVIPSTAGGFTIREIGLFDSDGDLIAVGSFPTITKLVNSRDLVVRFVLITSGNGAITIQIDPKSVPAPYDFVNRKTAALSRVINVKDYGVVGDGVTDDTAALQSILDNLVTDGTILYFPSGKYKLKSTLVFSNLKDVSIEGDGIGVTEINATGFTGQHFIFDDCQRITLKNFRLTGEGINGANAVGGIWFKITNAPNNPHHIIESVEINGVTNDGLVMAVPILVNLRNVKVIYVAGNCFNFYNGTSVHLDACYAITSTEAGFKFTNMTYCVLNACAAEVNGVGYDFVNSKSIVCNGCGSEDQLNRSVNFPGFAFRTDGQKVQLNACYARTSAGGHLSEVNGGKFTLVDFFDGDTFSFLPSTLGGGPKVVDLTNATSDYNLAVGEVAVVNFTNATNVPLNIATQDGTYYELQIIPSVPGGRSGAAIASCYLWPNNTSYSNSFSLVEIYRDLVGSGNGAGSGGSSFRIGVNYTSSIYYITNRTVYKEVKGFHSSYGTSSSFPRITIESSVWEDTTTPWTSLGTLVFPQSTSGTVLVRRIM